MSRRETEKAVKQILMSSYGHYSRSYEHKIITEFLQGNDVPLHDLTMHEFPLASQPLRSAKNSMICMVAVICRYAADLGADDERCYALSDYYINKIETGVDINNWHDFQNEILNHYTELVHIGREETHTLPVRRAIRYINQHLYEPCSLRDVAAAIKLTPSYLSALFKSETGISLTHYVRDKKIREARSMLHEDSYSISEVADMLGFGSVSYFSKVFRIVNSCSPQEFVRGCK
ncbi:helix-turn-helix domain-containing protein [Anaerocolumna sp. MB42-C2]|uniref:helix-turn-helix domain-containing protein n=1 Tax=Anaerocolumna sp. MB42-C2 TaxID=3070997 RepID=UPI0027DFE3D0|nr:helix-turn-helix domain-containing protein [Anaerocolumna sp. MB42-C2]WMJ87110.1 helix-turn-helix domain-containing protein [Anaerocolumna sp. MB42-C2]